jgi:hypothetical protein
VPVVEGEVSRTNRSGWTALSEWLRFLASQSTDIALPLYNGVSSRLGKIVVAAITAI